MLRLNDLEAIQGGFLVASPLMQDERFKRTVIFLSQVKMKASFGFMISAKEKTKKFKSKLKGTVFEKNKIFFGGPVDEEKLFVIHTTDFLCDSSLKITEKIAVTNFKHLAKQNILPNKFRLVAGYANWNVGQLDQETGLGYWLLYKNEDVNFLFEDVYNEKWDLCMKAMNINQNTYVHTIGNA